ncbi:unnamed protein product [Schistosoma curassoni]|nr:unnamed protein product [Schistosoma curassoni]
MRDERKRVKDQEGSEKRDSRRPLTVRDVSLIRLAKNGDLDSIKQMIKEGVNINEQDETGWTVLHEACVRNLPRMVDYLLRHGADPSISNISGEMALHCAARVGCLRIVRALIYYNADPLVSNHRGEKPLDLCHDPEVSSFLKQHTETNQSHMLTSSGSGKSSHSKVRQHAHGTKHLMSSFSGTTISSSTEYYGGGGKDNSSIASPSNVCSDSEDDGHSHSGLSVTTNTSHHNISPINTNQQLDLNCLSSTGHHNHPTSSPSLSSVPKSVTDVHISSAKSLKKDPYAFEDDENDETVNNSGNSLLHSASGVNNSNNTNTQATGHIGVHSGCGVSVGGPANLNKSTSSNSTISSSTTTTITTTTTTTTSVNTNTNTSPNSNISLGSIDSLSKHTRQLSSSNLSTTVECGNTTLDSNNDNTLTTLTGTINSALTTTTAPNNSSNYTTSNNNCASIGGPPLRLRFAKEAGQYTLMEHQQQQIDLSLSNCDANLAPSSCGIICTTTEASHVTVISDSDNDNKNMNFQMDIDNNNNNNSNDNVSNEHNSNMGTSMTIKSEPIIVSGDEELNHDTHRHRSGRTLRSHTAAQREKEEKERHTDDATPIKKRKLRSRSDTVTNHENISHQSRSGGGIGTVNVNNSPVTTVHAGSSTESSNVSLSSNAVANMDVIEDTHGCSTVTASSQSDSHMDNEEKKVSVGSSQSTVLMDKDTTDVHMTCVSEMEGGHSVSSSTTTSSTNTTATTTTHTHTPTPTNTTTTTTTDNDNSNKMEVDGKPEMCGTAVSVVTLNMDGSNDVNVVSSVSEVGVTTVVTTTVGVAGIATSTPSSSSLAEQISGCYSEADCDMSYLFCPSAPGDEDRKDVELLKFQNPYDKAAELNKNLRELVNNLVKVHPKAPCGYQDYLLVTRNYLLANQLSFATYVKRSAPSHLEATFVELFNEQEEERYAQALKHQSEREHLQLGAEQAVLRAQTRGALAVANQSKPYSFCSILSYNDLTYIPPVGKLENREEENIRDRFTPRTFIGWLQDIIDTFQNEKKKLLCRQLHEAESLMMVQKLDWEMKTRETLASNIDCIGVVDVFKDIPANYVPLIPVPNDFPLFAHDPVHRTTTATTTTAAPVAAATTATTMSTTPSTSIPITPTTNTTTHTAVNNSPTVSATTTTLTNNS